MITQEDMIREGESFFAETEIDFISEDIKYEENSLRYPYNCYMWSSAIQLNFKYQDEFYFINIGYKKSDNKFLLRGWHKDYDGYKEIFNLPPGIGSSVLGHFTGYDSKGSYVLQPFKSNKSVPEDIQIIKFLETIKEFIENGELF